MTRRRLVLTSALVPVLTLPLAACGGDTGTVSSTTSTTVASSTTATTAAAATTSVPSPTATAATTTSRAASGPTTATATPAPTTGTPGADGTETVTATATVTRTAAPQAAARPGATALYLVAPDGDGRTEQGTTKARPRLFREFVVVPSGGASGTAADQAATRAIAAVMQGAPAPYLRPWGEQSVVSTRKDASGITVTLSGAAPTTDAETARVAVASLVWTATAAYGADVPVRFVVPGGTIIGHRTTARTYRRATGQAQADELAGIWIDSPGMGQAVPAGRVGAKGLASVWEANLRWTLTKDGAQVGQGITTASVGAPERGTWSVDLGTLAKGAYTLTLVADSAVDGGGAMSRVSHTFTVR